MDYAELEPATSALSRRKRTVKARQGKSKKSLDAGKSAAWLDLRFRRATADFYPEGRTEDAALSGGQQPVA